MNNQQNKFSVVTKPVNYSKKILDAILFGIFLMISISANMSLIFIEDAVASKDPLHIEDHLDAKSQTIADIDSVDKKKIFNKAINIQIPFIANEGQAPKEISFYAKTFGGRFAITRKGEMVYSFTGFDPTENNANKISRKVCKNSVNLKETLVGASVNLLESKELSKTRVNYFIGSDKSKWKTNIATYNSVSLGEVYKGVELSLRAYGKTVEKVFTVKPGGSPESIRLKMEGIKSLRINDQGELVLETGSGEVRFSKPVAYQEKEGKKENVQVAYSLDEDSYGFSCGKYDRTLPLVVDPVLSFSTFLGGSGGGELGYGVAVDGAGDVYVTGYTSSANFPTTSGAYQETIAGGTSVYDAYVAKIDPDTPALIYATFLGGSSYDSGRDISVDNLGYAYVTGSTISDNFPATPNAYDTVHIPDDGMDAFVTKISPSGGSLEYSTFLGGTDSDDGLAIKVDGNGSVWVAGNTISTDFPEVNEWEVFTGGLDGFVTKFAPSGQSVEFSSYVGGTASDGISDIQLDGNGNAYITGRTASADFPGPPTPYYVHGSRAFDDVFITKIDATTYAHEYTAIIGGSGDDAGTGVDVDSENNVYLTGYTYSGSNFPTTQNSVQGFGGWQDAFVVKLNADGSSILYSTYLGGSDGDQGSAIAVDGYHHMHVAGITNSSDFPLVRPIDATYGSGTVNYDDIFVTSISADGTAIGFSTYLSGTGENHDKAYDIAIDASRSLFITGYSFCSDFPTLNTLQSLSGTADAIVVKMDQDADTDADLIPDYEDNCPLDSNSSQLDTDADATGDACDECDTDPNKITPGVCGCGVIEDFTDTDNDGTWNCVDSDDDNDGLLDVDEAAVGTDPLDPDSDDDLLSDGYEVQMGTDPNSAASTPPIPFTGALQRTRQPDGTLNTLIHVIISEGFVGTLPGTITQITVRAPDNIVIAETTSPTDWYVGGSEFYTSLPGEPPLLLGVYTFEVQTSSLTGWDSDYHYTPRDLPIPDVSTFLPADGAVVTSQTPSFSWQRVNYTGNFPLFYELEIYEQVGVNYQKVFGSGRIKDLASYTLPLNTLKPSTSYRWRIRLMDNSYWADAQNRTNSDMVYFTTPATFDAHSSVPALDLNGWGNLSWTWNVGQTGTEVWVQVYDLDGVSSDGSSHSVTIQRPDDPQPAFMDFARSNGVNSSFFEYWYDIGPVAGTYTFTITDPDGNTATLTETLYPADINPLNPPDSNTITPNLLSEHITARFDNVYVNGNPTVFEDFDGYNSINDIDWSKWEWYQNAAIQQDGGNGWLVIDIGNSVGRASGQLSFADKSSINAIRADITITNTTTETPRAETGGSWCHNGVGDVTGRIRVTSNRVYYSVSQEYFNEQDTYHWDTALSSGTLLTGDFESVPVTVEIDWDEPSSTLTFFAEAGTDSNTATYVVVGNVGPPINQYKDLRARINLVTDTTPTFTWAPVAFTNSDPLNPTYANRYRLRIYNHDTNNRREIWRGTFGEQTEYEVPPGVLKPGSYYRFRVEALDSHSPLNLNNLSKTPPSNDDNFIFYTNDQEAVDPFIELDNSGVRTWNDPVNGAFLHFRIKVHDAQGVPDNISSVTVEHPNGSVTTLNPSCSDSFSPSTPTSCIYSKSSFQPIEGGDYIFTVVDLEGHINTVTETLTPGVLDLPVLLSPASGLPIGDTAVDFNWSDVTDAKFYSVDIFDWDYNLVYTFHTEQSNFYLAAGFLKSQTLYRWRVKARREYITENLDNNSSSSGFWTMSTFATTPPADLDQDGIPDYWEELHGLDPAIDDADLDSDGDGLTNIQEFENATDPQSLDTDGDSLWDGDEILFGTRPRSMDTDDDGVNDFDDQFPTDITEWADYDSDLVGDNSDNCPLIRNSQQRDYDGDGKGDLCDDDADDDGFLSPYTANGDDCNDLNENIYPVWDDTDERYECNGEPIDGLAPKIKPPPVEEEPPSDGDTVDPAIDNCPDVANQDQLNGDGDTLGDACDNCDDFPNDNQVLPWWYKDADNDGYTSGDRLQQCDSPAPGLYKREDDAALLSTLVFDCNDDDVTFFPGADDLAKDCDPNTQSPADAQPYNIVIENITLFRGTNETPNMAYGIWDPQADDKLTVVFKVTGQPEDVTTTLNSRDEKLAGPIQYADVLMTHYEGDFLNDDNNANNDFTPIDLSQDQDNQVSFTILDYGGVITFKAMATVVTNASSSTPGIIPIEKVFSFPKDLDNDKVPDFYEANYPGDLLPDADQDGDGLTTLEEYRGVKWGRLVRQEPGEEYNTAAYLPATLPSGSVEHIRTSPVNRTLFVKFSGFESVQFAIGEAFHTLVNPVEVYALGDTVIAAEGLKDYHIDVASVIYNPGTYGAESGHIIDRSDRDWIFSTLGASSFGNEVDYGANCNVFQPSMEAFFGGDRPYLDGATFDGTASKEMKIASNWSGANGILDPVGLVEDGNDNGSLDVRENLVDLDPPGQLDGDHPVPCLVVNGCIPDTNGDGWIDVPWEYNHNFSPFDIDNNGMVELPVVAEPILENYQFTIAQGVKHVTTHELGHNVGVTLHTTDSTCVMYEYTNDLLRDGHFSPSAAEKIRIHNQ